MCVVLFALEICMAAGNPAMIVSGAALQLQCM
jgi:hypothetical protein